jgi:hypothetical protein
MCANNLREGVFDSYAIDPPHSREDSFFIIDWIDPSDPSFFLPAVQRPTGLADRPSESDHGFELMV